MVHTCTGNPDVMEPVLVVARETGCACAEGARARRARSRSLEDGQGSGKCTAGGGHSNRVNSKITPDFFIVLKFTFLSWKCAADTEDCFVVILRESPHYNVGGGVLLLPRQGVPASQSRVVN